MEALKPESINRRSYTSRRTPPTPHTTAGGAGSQDLAATNHLFRAPDWKRRAGEWSHWGGLGEGRRESGVSLHRQQASRTQHASRRPASCMEGGAGMEGWLQQLEEMQRRHSSSTGVGLQGYASGSGVPVVPPLSDRTVSMPLLPNHPAATGQSVRHTDSPSSLCSEDLLVSLTDSWSATPLGSDESLWPQESAAGSRERVSIGETPRAQYSSMSSLTPVKIGWLPIQRRLLLVDDASSQTRQPHAATHNGPCQVKMKPPITPVFSKSAVKANGFGYLDGTSERCHGRPATAPVKTCVPPAQTLATSSSALIAQSASRVQRAPVERGTVAGSPQPWRPPPPWRAWPERREAPTCADASRKPTLLGRSSSCTTPPLPPHASSLSSSSSCETLHSAVSPPSQAKPGFSSITITSRKVTRSSSLPESRALAGSERPRSASPAGSASGTSNMAASPLRRRAVVVKMTESRVNMSSSSSSSSSSSRAHNSPQVAFEAAFSPAGPKDPCVEPVILRRKATIVKVTEERETYRLSPVQGEGQSQARRSEVRYSYTEGLQPARYASEPRNLEQGVPRLHRSTLSLLLTPAPLTDPSGSQRVDAGGSMGRRRPLSFHAGMFHSQPALESLSSLPPGKERTGLPHMTNVEPVHLTSGKVPPSAAPLCVDSTHPEARTRRQAQELTEGKPLPGAISRSPPPPTLINSSDSSQLTHDTILARNAAAIIANIKLQRQLSKKREAAAANDSAGSETQRGPARGEAGRDAGNPGNHAPQEREGARQDGVREEQPRRPYADFVPLTLSFPQEASSLTEALRLHRPGFISRSEARVKEFQRRAQHRREQQQQQDRAHTSTHLTPHSNHNRAAHTRTKLHDGTDNLFKSRDRAVAGREPQQRSRRSHVSQTEMKRRREEEKRKAVSQTNRLRMDIFKKKLLDQLLHRGTD